MPDLGLEHGMEIAAHITAPPLCHIHFAVEVRFTRGLCYNAICRRTRFKAFLCAGSTQDHSRSKSWSDANLTRELREFMAANGLPPDKVPTTKELAYNGRQDLANVVRRRGYRAIAELLAAASEPFSSKDDGPEHAEKSSDSNDVPRVQEVFVNGSAKTEVDLSGNKINQSGSCQPEYLNLIRQTDSYANAQLSQGEPGLNASQLLQENFLHTGQINTIEDNNEKGKGDEEDYEEVYTTDENTESWDASDLEKETMEMVALKKAALLRSKLLPFLKPRDATSQEQLTTENLAANSKEVHDLLQNDKDPQPVLTAEDPMEMEATKAALQSREEELAVISTELEERKAQLSLVQAKATAELSQAKQAAMEKEMRLSAAEHALANLKQVKVEWWGNASKVELAGSFNGWQHFFVLEPDLASEIRNPDGTRGPLMWETEMWLYPGVYEIKFIVDGQWQIDHRREVVMKNMNQNNILRVDL